MRRQKRYSLKSEMFSAIRTAQGKWYQTSKDKDTETAVVFEVDDMAADVVAIICVNWRNGC